MRTMQLAVRYRDVLLDPGRGVAGHDAGATLVRRLLRLFPGARLIGPEAGRYGPVEVVPLEAVDGDDTVVVSMDAVDTFGLWRTLRGTCARPQLVNLVWWSRDEHADPAVLPMLALSCALFPTLANSERTATEITEVVRRWTVPPLAGKARVAWVNLGFRLEHVQPRVATDVPVVLYPAIYLSPRKQPELFVDVVSRVARRVPIQVEARLHESSLVSDAAMILSRHDWAWVGPLTARREDYWHALARTTAFLATAVEESYGLMYVEALAAGAVGVLPDLPWARALLPAGYPFLYRTPAEAEEMLVRAVTDSAACRAELDAAAGGDFAAWLRAHHDDDDFERVVAERVAEWFGPVPALV